MTTQEHALNCYHCGAWHSRYGLGLTYIVNEEGGPPVKAICVQCGVDPGRLDRLWFPMRNESIFQMVQRVPWVPTEEESSLLTLWRMDYWFAERNADVW